MDKNQFSVGQRFNLTESSLSDIQLINKNTLNCSANEINFTYIKGQNNISIHTIDTFGFIASDTSTWTYTYLENNVTLNIQSYETDTEIFSINVEGATTVALVYDGTEYTTTKSGNDFSRTIQIPTGSTGNKTVYWIFDGVQNSSIHYQNVLIVKR